MQQPMIFKSGGCDIYGMLHTPRKLNADRLVPIVIFCHGFTGTKVESHRIFVKMARALEKHNIASLRFDFRGCGDSGGDFVNTTVGDHIRDAHKALDYAMSLRGINKTRVGLIGLSLGGAIASYIAGRNLRIKVLALWAPAADLLDEAQQIRKDKNLKKIRKLKAIDYEGTLVGKRFVAEIPVIQPLLEIEKYNGSALILHGTKDESVPLRHSLKFYRIMKKKGLPVKRHLIKGADHTFTSYYWEQEVIQRTLKFFIEYL